MFPKSAILFSCLVFLLSSPIKADFNEVAELRAAYQYLNQLREDADMKLFKKNLMLEKSAGYHAHYLSVNAVIAHLEKPGRPAFSGIKPSDRALAAGYNSKIVTENFSSGQKNSFDSIEGLMSAIYHRFGFLDFSKDEVGIAFAVAETGVNFGYNMGNDQQNRFCQNSIYEGKDSYYQDVCKSGEKVSVKKFDQLANNVMKENPSIIVWPPKGSEQVLTVFYEEIPDPLPSMAVSGYPVSIQFNPYYYNHVSLIRFELYKSKTGALVHPVHVMHKKNDPNHKFTELEFALFPLNRLERGTSYRAEVEYEADGKLASKTWDFTTKALQYPMFVISAHEDFLSLKQNDTYAIYIPPDNQLPFIENLRWESESSLQASVILEDKNTILVTLSGELCKQAQFTMNGERSFFLRLSSLDNLNTNQYYPKKSALSCILQTEKNLPGFKIEAKGETLKMKSGQAYWVEMEAESEITNSLKMQYIEGMRVEVKHLGRNLLKISLTGKPGQKAAFFLNSSRSFEAIIANEN